MSNPPVWIAPLPDSVIPLFAVALTAPEVLLTTPWINRSPVPAVSVTIPEPPAVIAEAIVSVAVEIRLMLPLAAVETVPVVDSAPVTLTLILPPV